FLTFVDDDTELTYGEFNAEVNRVAHGLISFGVHHGDFVAIMLRNSVIFLITSYALKKVGAVEVAVNAEFRGPGLARMLNLTKLPLLITAEEFLEPLGAINDDLGHLQTVILTDSDADAATALGG